MLRASSPAQGASGAEAVLSACSSAVFVGPVLQCDFCGACLAGCRMVYLYGVPVRSINNSGVESDSI